MKGSTEEWDGPLPPTRDAVSELPSFPWTHAKPGNHAGFGQYHLKLEWTGRRGPPQGLAVLRVLT